MAGTDLEVADEVIYAPVADIRIGDRLRPIDPVWAAALGAIMSAEGQHDPIKITRLPGQKDFTLVAGGHRLAGAKLEGWDSIQAIVVLPNAHARRQQEISENLWRKGLDPIDRAAFVAELIALHKQAAGVDPDKDGRAVSANVRWQKALKADSADAMATVAVAYGFAADLSQKIGLSERTIRGDLELYRRLLPDVVGKIRGLPVASSAGQLRALARLPYDDQRAVAQLLVDGANSVTDALATIQQKPKPDPSTKAWSAFFGSWSRMSGAMRRAALTELRAQGLPRGVSITFSGESDA
jgi:hypothetical protein